MNTSDKDKSIGTEKGNNTPVAAQDRTSEDRFSALQDLKAVFLAMDWEINDQTTTKLIDESEKLMRSSEGDIVLVAYFKMLSSLAKYIKAHKATADKDAVGLLGSVYESMEKVIDVEGMPDAERERLVLDEIHKFLELKKKVTGSKGIRPSVKSQRTAASAGDIKKIQKDLALLHEEVASLRRELVKIQDALNR
ncbi:MAG: hypothetical protein DSY90_01500 [Deltaproteobacteria bacterium]|nr:MAG: hypothetical protein DSY90_01500 [Deltaproteobacteria bacterium]